MLHHFHLHLGPGFLSPPSPPRPGGKFCRLVVKSGILWISTGVLRPRPDYPSSPVSISPRSEPRSWASPRGTTSPRWRPSSLSPLSGILGERGLIYRLLGPLSILGRGGVGRGGDTLSSIYKRRNSIGLIYLEAGGVKRLGAKRPSAGWRCEECCQRSRGGWSWWRLGERCQRSRPLLRRLPAQDI